MLRAKFCRTAAGASVILLASACGDDVQEFDRTSAAPDTSSVATAPAAAPDSSSVATAPSAPAAVEQQTPAATAAKTDGDAIDIVNWDQAQLRGGISAERLIGMDVRGSKGESIGEVENILVNEQGRATAVVVESGGFLDIGDTHFRIPWEQAKIAADLEHVIVPLSNETAERYRDTREREKVTTGAREYRVSELENDVVTLSGGTAYGRVDDFIVSRDGEVQAIVVEATQGMRGRYVYPYRTGAFDFTGNAYRLPYELAQVNNLKPFDYAAAGISEPTTSATGATGGAGVEREGRAGEERAPRQTRG